MVATLGGPADFMERPLAYLPKAPIELAVTAEKNGFVTGIATRDIGLAVVALGGGRTTPDDVIDHAVGITGLLPVGAEAVKGEPLAIVHARSRNAAEKAAQGNPRRLFDRLRQAGGAESRRQAHRTDR